jgi:hypothetical protein
MVAQNNVEPMSSPRAITSGLRGWWKRLQWKREARDLQELDIDGLRKRIVILDHQLELLPTSSSVHRRRMELLEERERCVIIIATWEQRYDSVEQPVEGF